MSNSNRWGKPESAWPPIMVMHDDARRLNVLASSSAMLFPRVPRFLAKEIERASVMADDSDLPGLVRMGSQVRYCDGRANRRRESHDPPCASRRRDIVAPTPMPPDMIDVAGDSNSGLMRRVERLPKGQSFIQAR